MPDCQLWFLDGKDANGKVVTNPNIGYGHQIMNYADGSSRAFYQIGISANKSGISIYVIGLKDKAYLSQTFEKTLGKASISGYCIKFKSLQELSQGPLEELIRYSFHDRNH